MNKPISTLFMLMSVDGKISIGNTDNLDVDKDFPKIKGVKEGLQQYYEIEQTTDLHFLITGAVMTKESDSLNVNKRNDIPKKVSANCIIIDSSHLNKNGVKYLTQKFNSLTVVTSNKSHPANNLQLENLKIIYYNEKIDFKDLFSKLKNDFKIESITIQAGGTLNSLLLREKLIDKISIVVAPVLIGGKETSSLIDGKSLSSIDELKYIKALKLVDVKKLDDSYLHLKYDVINDTVLDYPIPENYID
jgi:2,5-diamino-6-(ribosylamino)-4(3H)-pyrimidinone 5'-phosphate reductase